jgi:DNA polymerase I
MEFFKNVDTGKDANGKSMQRVKEAQAKQEAKNYEPTWDEVWITGWTAHTGSFKKGIFQTKVTEKDVEKLRAVKDAIEAGEIGSKVDSMKKFSKAHALNLHKELMEIRREGIVKKMIANKPDNYHLINTEDGLGWVISLLKDAIAKDEVISLDTETTGVSFVDRTVGLSISFDSADIHVYVPYAHVTDVAQLTRGYVMKKIKPYLEQVGVKLILHNSKFDAHMLLKDGINIRENIYFDTMIAMAILNENEESYALKKLANKYGRFFGYEDESLTFEELFGKSPQAFIESDIILATIYASKDTHLTLLFYKWMISMMDKQPKLKSVYFDIEQKNTHVALEMEGNGFEIDFDFAETYKEELTHQVGQLEDKIRKQWGEVNINSPKQLQELFYNQLGFDDVSGKQSVDAKTIKKLSKKHPEVNVLLEYRELNKLLSTYVIPLPEKVRQDTKRLHGQFNQTATVTGRWASKEPNLQNLPPRARKLIKAPEGKLMIGIDYSQIEPRTLASMSKDLGLREPYIKGIDLYATLASKIFKLPYEACLESDADTYKTVGLPKHPRKMMKVGLLAVMYGITVPSLAESLSISIAEAQKFMDDFYEAYPVMTKWMQEQVDFADENGFVETLHGRKRRFIGHQIVAKQYKAVHKKVVNILGREPQGNIWQEPLPKDLKRQYWNVKKEYARVERMSVNAIIQGSASEILKKAMIAVYEWCKGKEGWRLLATIHDELLFEIPETATPEEILELQELMINTTKLDNVPIKCDIEVMTVWGEGIPFAEWQDKGMGREAFKA